MTTPEKSTSAPWDIPRYTGREGTGNWDAYGHGLTPIFKAAEKWRAKVNGIENLWLCWNIDDDWCRVQQKIILDAGWTPVIGWDPNCSPEKRTVLKGSVEIDFNADFNFPALWPHFPLEFAFLWSEKLAFWHADLLVRKKNMQKLVSRFESLKDGEMAAVKSTGGLRNMLRFKQHRYWELIGCTTAGAGRDQFEKGCGWWRHFYRHPKTPPDQLKKRSQYYYDSGVGIMFWEKYYGKKVVSINEKMVKEGHCSEIGNQHYVKGQNKSDELRKNFNLHKVLEHLDLSAYED